MAFRLRPSAPPMRSCLPVATPDPGAGLLVVGAYRSNEVDPAHPLALALDAVERAGTPLAKLEVGPLAREDVAQLLADSDTGASQGGLLGEGRQLSTLIGRPTTPLAATIAAAVRG